MGLACTGSVIERSLRAYTEVLEEQLEILAEPRDSHRLDGEGGIDRADAMNPGGV